MEHQTLRFAKMILRDMRSTSYDLAFLFRGRRSTLEMWARKNWNNAVVRGRQYRKTDRSIDKMIDRSMDGQ